MKPVRRQFLGLAAIAIGLPAISRVANAQAYPARPVRIVVGFAAGGAPDIAAFQERARFIRISGAGLRESHVHDVMITREAPNYPSQA